MHPWGGGSKHAEGKISKRGEFGGKYTQMETVVRG